MKVRCPLSTWLLLVWALTATLHCLGQPTWQAGVATANITPTEPLWMAGFASRTNPATGKATDLWLKVLALQDARGHRAVILTSDLLGFTQPLYQHTCAALKQKCGLAPEQILLTASHTHCGPVLRGADLDMYPLDDIQRARIDQYSVVLETKIVEATVRALAALAPVRLAAGEGTARFAVNRRNNPEPAVPKLIEQGALRGPVDHTVPVLAVYQPDGLLKAVLFGYACHNTVMAFDQWSGDYAGYAQIALEKSHPEAIAMFFMGCGGDQNPLPRNRSELAERYGHMLAAAVEEVLLSPPRPLPPQLDTAMEMVTLHLGAPPSQAELEKTASDKALGTHRWAQRLLADLSSGKPLARSYPYPLQAWRFGGTQLLLTLGGEPVVDYSLTFRSEFGAHTWVAGYCNDVVTYIPSLRVLKEDMPPLAEPRWGYEGSRALIYDGLPALRWAEDVQALIQTSARRLVKRLQASDR